MKQYHILRYFAFLLAWAGGTNARCDRTPPNIGSEKSSGDGQFYLSIEGNSQTYIPGESYLVTLKSDSRKTFTSFLVTAEADGGPFPGDLHVDDSRSLTTYSTLCSNSITAISAIAKNMVTMRWTAPRSGSGCVSLLATVLEKHNVWYQDEGALTRKLCEDNSDIEHTTVSDESCPKNEAKYLVSFRGMWSRNTHPRHFPENEWETGYSDLIGASHSVDFRFWDHGTYASEGLKKLAEFGATDELENELLKEIGPEERNVRTIIKSKGQKYPDRNAETYAIFRVDSKYHVVSLVSSILPSPDWFLGVSAYELCHSNQSWIKQISIDLFPWDAGTDKGVSYMSYNDPKIPPDTISRLRVDSPNNPNSAFYDPDVKEMNPFAKLTFTLLREYEVRSPVVEETEPETEAGENNDDSKEAIYEGRTSYPPDVDRGREKVGYGGGGVQGSSSGQEAEGECPRMSAWGEWTDCAPRQTDHFTCGDAGVQFRQRRIKTNQPKDAPRNEDGECDDRTGDIRDCDVECEEQRDNSYNVITSDSLTGPVQNVGLTGDGSLTGKDGPAKKTYFKTNFPDKRSRSINHGHQNDPYRGNMNQNPFNGMNAESLVLSANGKNQVQVYVSPDNSKDCKMSRWSQWSKCQGDCGVGERIRFRNIMRHNQNGGKACPKKLIKYRKCPLPPCN